MKKAMKNFFASSALVLFLMSLSIPAVSFAQTTGATLAYNCDGTATSTDASGTPPCDFNALINTGTNLIEWMFYVSVPIMVALLAYAGILYMTGLEKNISKAKGMFLKVAGGFTIMLIAFVVINTLVGWIGNSSFTTTSGGATSNPAVFLQQSSQ
jgi:hypothetical protein